MRIGDLTKRVSLQQRISTTGTMGQSVETWTEIAKVWAAIEPLTAQQRVVSQAIHPDISHRITVRYRPDYANATLLSSLRIVYRGRFFSLHGGLNLNERNVQVDLTAAEGINHG
jgi:SPP1 family predicted phage head-tail adaptor